MRRLLLLLALGASGVAAQTAIGVQVGSPTGLSLKAGDGRGAILLAVGYDLGDSISAEGHYVLRRRRLEGGDARWYYGPGAFLRGSDDDLDLGVSLAVGVETLLTRDVEGYAHVSPRLQLVDETEIGLGLALGARVRF